MTDLIQREMDVAASQGEVWEALTDPDWLGSSLADAVELEAYDQDPTPRGSNPYTGPNDRFARNGARSAAPPVSMERAPGRRA